MLCKDKFLLQSTVVPANTDVDDLPPDTVRMLIQREVICSSFIWKQTNLVNNVDFCIQFNKDSGKTLEECKLRVVYLSPTSAQGNSEFDALGSSAQSAESNSVSLELLC